MLLVREPPPIGLCQRAMFRVRVRKKGNVDCKQPFYNIKVNFKGVRISRLCSHNVYFVRNVYTESHLFNRLEIRSAEFNLLFARNRLSDL